MKVTTIIAFCLVLIGALVWFMVGVFNFNLVAYLFGSGYEAWISRVIYSLVGVSAIWLLFYWIVCDPFRNMG